MKWGRSLLGGDIGAETQMISGGSNKYKGHQRNKSSAVRFQVSSSLP